LPIRRCEFPKFTFRVAWRQPVRSGSTVSLELHGPPRQRAKLDKSAREERTAAAADGPCRLERESLTHPLCFNGRSGYHKAHRWISGHGHRRPLIAGYVGNTKPSPRIASLNRRSGAREDGRSPLDFIDILNRRREGLEWRPSPWATGPLPAVPRTVPFHPRGEDDRGKMPPHPMSISL
jgi:hypothetical protein